MSTLGQALQAARPSSLPALRLLFAIQLIAMGAMEMSGPFWPVHLRSLTSNEQLFSLAAVGVYVAPMLGLMLSSAFWGRIGDRHGHKLMMMRALLGLGLTQLALCFCTEVWSILALRFLQGTCAGFIAPAQAYGVSIAPAQGRARLFAFLQIATNLGSLGGALLGGLILDQSSFVWINALAACLCALCLLATWLCLPRSPIKPPSPPPLPRAMAEAPTPWLRGPIAALLLISALLLLARMLGQSSFALYVQTEFAVGNWLTGLCYGLMALGFVSSATRWAAHFEGKSAPQVLPQIALVATACALLTGLAGMTQHIGLFIALHFAWGIALGATTPILSSLISRAAGPERQGRVLGLAQSSNQFASIGGIALGMGFCQWLGLQHLFAFIASFYAIAALSILLLRGRISSPLS